MAKWKHQEGNDEFLFCKLVLVQIDLVEKKVQKFFSKLFKPKDDSPIGLVSLGINQKQKSQIKKDSLAYNADRVNFTEKIYEDKKILTINDFID